MKRSKPQRRKEKQLKKILKSKKGLEKLGAAMAAPIMNSLNYTSIMRKVLLTVTPIPGGALPDYDTEELSAEEKEELRIANKSW